MPASDHPLPDDSARARDSGARVILMADRSGDAQRIADALRREGFAIVSSDVVALPERASRLDPIAVVVDIEQAHADVALSRLREGSDATDASASSRPGREAVIVALGNRSRARELNVDNGPRSRVFPRPVDVDALATYLREVATFGPSSGRRAEPHRDGPSAPSSLAAAVDSDALLVADFPAIAGLPEVESILPELDGDPASARLASQLSREIEALLEQGARRVNERPGDDEPSAPHDPDILVPTEILTSIDELLNVDDDDPFAGRREPSVIPTARVDGRADDAASSDRASGRRASASEIPRTGPGELTGVAPGTYVEAPTHDSSPPHSSAHAGDALGSSGWPITRQPETTERDPFPHQRARRTTSDPAPSSDARSGSEPPLTTKGPSLFDGSGPKGPSLFDGSGPKGPSLFDGSGPKGPSLFDPHEQAHSARERGRLPAASIPAAISAPPTLQRAIYTGPPGHGLSTAPMSSQHPSGRTRVQPMEFGQADGLVPITGVGAPPMPPPSERSPLADPTELLATAVRSRASGSLLFLSSAGERARRILLREGDLVNAASDVPQETLVQFLVDRGDLNPGAAELKSVKLPQAGRHAAAALIAHGFLGQDDLWPVLRAHAEWVIGRALADAPAVCELERDPPERLRAEPNVFGGAAGVEVFVDTVRRVLPPEEALRRLGGPDSQLRAGPSAALLAESALSATEDDAVRASVEATVGQVIAHLGLDFVTLLYALTSLHILSVRSRQPISVDERDAFDPLDSEAVRQRIRARVALVREGHYFALLGIEPSATAYDIRRAYVGLRRLFDASRLLTAATADLAADVALIVEVLDEAYEVLRDANRRNRYRRAIEAPEAR